MSATRAPARSRPVTPSRAAIHPSTSDARYHQTKSKRACAVVQRGMVVTPSHSRQPARKSPSIIGEVVPQRGGPAEHADERRGAVLARDDQRHLVGKRERAAGRVVADVAGHGDPAQPLPDVSLYRSAPGRQLVRGHRAGARHRRPQAQPVTENDQRPGDGHTQFAEHLADRLFHLLLVDSHQDLLFVLGLCPDGVRSRLTIVRWSTARSRPAGRRTARRSRCWLAGAGRAPDGPARSGRWRRGSGP